LAGRNYWKNSGSRRWQGVATASLFVLVTLLVLPSTSGSWNSLTSSAAPAPSASPALVSDSISSSATPSTIQALAAGNPLGEQSVPALTADGRGVEPHLAPLNLPGPHPAAWGPLGLPPGLPTVQPPVTGNGVDPCNAVWPSLGGQAILPAGCVGHDEPNLAFYSDAPGSGGNVSWTATLPVDVSATQNQSNLYSAVWFGLVVGDPAGWLGQCYVEIQLYPDFSWSSPNTTTPGTWGGAVVGWQIDPRFGTVDTCFYSPLYVNGSSAHGPFSMSQGDSFTLRMLGFSGSGIGESVWLNDTSSGAQTRVTLYNSTGGFPLNPAYPQNDVSNALLWTTGAQTPISFGLEIGRAGNSVGVSNSTYGGCSPGPRSPSPVDPAVPCPSYDPLSWVNDTQTPWSIGVPTFPGPGGSATPAQFGVSSTVGGSAAIPTLSNGTCGSRIGSAFCTYPWFSYACSAPAFTFGATDYAEVTNDFGQSSQYPTSSDLSFLGLPAFTPGNYSIPSCSAHTFGVGLSTHGPPGGSISFLSKNYTSASNVSGLLAGEYSIDAAPPAGDGFADWATTGGASVAVPTSPTTTLTVTGSGSVSATFTATPALTQVWFNSSGGGLVVVTPGASSANGTPAWSVPAGTDLSLAAGVYGIQAGPPVGDAFEDWSVGSGVNGVVLASPSSAVTWLTVTGATTTSEVVAIYTPVVGSVTVTLMTSGGGTLTIGGTTVPYDTATGVYEENVSLSAGTYAAVATPAPGWAFLTWSYAPSAVLVSLNATANVSFAPGVASLTAIFAASVTATILPAADGRVVLDGIGPLATGATSWLPRGTYSLFALPFGGASFVNWTVNNTSALWVAKTGSSITVLQVNSTGLLTAVFAPNPSVNVTFVNNPAAGGEIRFNYQYLTGASIENTTLTNGTYLIRAIPTAGYVFRSWSLTNPPLSLSAGNLVVKGSGGTITANFARADYAVSFVSEGNSGSLAASIGGSGISSGQTLNLAPGKYPLVALVGPNTTFLKWVPTGNMFVGNPFVTTTNLTVYGAGTLTGIADPFVVAGVSATPPVGDVGVSVRFQTVVTGTSPESYLWSGLPAGCLGADHAAVTCVPTAAGTSPVVVSVTGANGLLVRSPALDYTVRGAVGISSFSASQSTIDLGMTVNFTVAVGGGSVPYSYVYTALPPGCTSANQSVLACSPSATGTTTVTVNVTDSVGGTATASLSLTVAPLLVVSNLTASRTVVTATISTDLSTQARGGSGDYTYSYSGLPGGCATTDSATLLCTPSATASGNFTVGVTVRDLAGATGSANVSLRVNPLPFVSAFLATPDPAAVDGNLTLTVVAGGGTGPLAFTYTGLPTGCSSVNASVLQCIPVLVGTFDIKVTLTDGFGTTGAGDLILTIQAHSTPPIIPPSSTGSTGTPWWVWVAIAAAIVVVLTAVLLVLRRRSQQKATPPP
jgi:hypothetical protein